MGRHPAVRRIREHARSSQLGPRLATAALVLVALAFATSSPFGAGSPSAAPAPPLLRSASTGQNAAASASLTVAKPAGVASGDVLVASVAARLGSGSPLNQPAGWSLVRRDDCSGPQKTDLSQAFFYKVAGGSEPASYTFGFSDTTAAAGSVLAFTGVDTASPLDGSAGRFTRNSIYLHGPSLTPSGEGRRLVGSFAHSGAQGVAVPSGMTGRGTSAVTASPTTSLTVADEALATAGETGNKTARGQAAESCNVAGVVLLRPAGGSSNPPPPPPPPPPPASAASAVASSSLSPAAVSSATVPATSAFTATALASTPVSAPAIPTPAIPTPTLASAPAERVDGRDQYAVAVHGAREPRPREDHDERRHA